MQIEFKSQRISLIHHHGHHSFVLEHQHGRRDVMWKRSIGLIPSEVIFTHGAQFFRGCHSRDAWNAQKTFSKTTSDKCFLHSQLSFCSAGPSLALCSLAVHYFAVYSVLGNLISNLNANGNEYNGCVSEGCNSVHFIAVTKQQCEMTTFCFFRENVNYDGQFLEFLFEFWRCLTYSVWDISHSGG